MKIEINVTLSADNALLAVLQALVNQNQPKQLASAIDGTPEKKKTKKEQLVTEVAPSTQETPVVEEKSNGTVQTDITMEDIQREAVPRSRAGHKDAIKEKIHALGYENMADMQSVHFEEFMTYLKTIPFPKPKIAN